MSKLILRIIIFLFCKHAFALPPDSIQTTSWKRPKFWFQLDRNNTFVSNKGANCSGFKVGLEFAKKYRFGLGYYELKSDIVEYKALSEEEAKNATNDTVKAKLSMITLPFCFEYVFYEDDPWQFSMPVNLGIGETYFTYSDKTDHFRRIKDYPVVDYEVSIAGQYKILRWFGVGAGIGYRLMLLDNPAKEHNFNSPIYSLKLKLFLGEIIHTIFPPKKKE